MSHLDVQPATNRDSWEAFQISVRPPTFLQSWAWGETQRALGEEIIRLTAINDGQTAGVAQAITVSGRRARFLHVPHGPVVAHEQSPDIIKALLETLKDEAKRRGLAFLRASPLLEDTERHRTWYRELGFRPAPIHMHAERLWILDLASSAEDLLAGMRKTTRNLVRRAEREGVWTRFSNDPADLWRFAGLYAETARREKFIPFSNTLLRAELSAFGAGGARIALAEQDGKLLAAAFLVSRFGSTFYHHGASSRTHPKVPAAYALQWAAISDAKARGDWQYNFWGTTAKPLAGRSRLPLVRNWKLDSHPWSGLTLFKTGFGGRAVDLVPTQDFPLTTRYWLNVGIETARRWRRRI